MRPITVVSDGVSSGRVFDGSYVAVSGTNGRGAVHVVENVPALGRDSVSVINTSFLQIEPEVIILTPWWQSLLNEAWVLNLAKQVLGAIGLLIIYLIFGRPFLRTLLPNRIEIDDQSQALAANNSDASNASSSMPQGRGTTGAGANTMGLPNLSDDPNNPAAVMRRKDATYDQKVDMARSLVVEDPARVANVMKNWVAES